MPLPTDTVGEGIMFSGCPFVQTDLVTHASCITTVVGIAFSCVCLSDKRQTQHQQYVDADYADTH